MLDPVRSATAYVPLSMQVEGPPRVDRSYRAPRGWLRVVLAPKTPVAEVFLEGEGDSGGLEALLGYLDRCSAALGPGERVRILVDVSRVTRVPAQAPLALGGWILAHRHQLERAGVVVGGGLVQALTRQLFHIAGVPGVRITTDREEARRWVG